MMQFLLSDHEQLIGKRSSRLLKLSRTLGSLALVAVILQLSLAAFGQRPTGGVPPPAKPAPPPQPPKDAFDQTRLRYGDKSVPALLDTGEKDTCFFPPLNGLQTSVVTVANLQVNAKAKKYYAAACAALNDKKYAEAEKHLRNAVGVDAKYPAAWVTLGQLLSAQQKSDEAIQACTHALKVDANYVVAYLCMADVSVREQHWDDVLKQVARALEIDPTNDAPAYAYSAVANLNLKRLAEAEKSGLRALEIDKNNNDPRVHFLMAQIYEAKRDFAGEAAELREYLKYATDPDEVAMVQKALADVEKRAKK